MQTSDSGTHAGAPPPDFETPRLLGRRIAPQHAGELEALHNDPQVMETLAADGKPFPPEIVQKVVANHVAHWSEHGFGSWVFFDRAGGAFVGRAGLRSVDLDGTREVELLYAVMPAWWRRGYATEMGRAILAEGFGPVGLDSIVAYTLETNRGSRAVMEKLGFRYERAGERKGLPHVFYRMTRADFRP